MGLCEQCRWFRRPKPASHLLAAVFTTQHAEVSQALNKIQEDEQKQRDAEAQFKGVQARAGDRDENRRWRMRPAMTEFCAFAEDKGIYYICELKNAGGTCGDFAAGTPERHACSNCRHRGVAEGRRRDQQTEELFARKATEAAIAKSSTKDPEQLLTAHRQGAAARQAFELTGAYNAKGVVAARPGYLDVCAALSTEDEFVVCALQNPWSTCGKWEPAQAVAAPAAAPDPRPQPAPISPPAPAPLTPTAPRGAAGETLVPGPRPLTRAILADAISALEWILDVQIPPAVRAPVESSIVSSWRSGDDIGGVLQFVETYRSVHAQNVETRDAIREENQAAVVASLRAQPGPAVAQLIALYDAANAPIAWGNPPLTHEIANCYFDLMGFVHSLAANTEWLPLPDQIRDTYAQMLAAQYSSLPPPVQAWLGTLPRGWTALRAAWRNATPEMRGVLRQQVLANAGDLPQFGPPPAYAQAPYAPPPPPAYGYPGQPVPAAMAPQPVAPASADGEKSADQLLADIVKMGKEEEEKLTKEDPVQAYQVRLQNNARNAQLLSNMMQMRHESMMAIVHNIH